MTRYCRTRGEAIAALNELRSSHGPLSGRTLTTAAYLERWVRDARDIRPTTRHGYEAAIVTHLVPTIGAIRIGDLNPLHVEAMLAQLAPTMAPKTLRNVHVVLRRALGQAVRAGIVTRNVASREFVDSPRVELSEPPSLTLEDLRRIRTVLPGHQLEAHITVALATGLRQGEQLGLAWEDVDLDASTLTVQRELARIGGKYRLVDPKTTRSRRTVPLAPAVVDVLRSHREDLVRRGFVPMSTGFVFVNTKGGALSGSWLTHAWYELLDVAGVNRKPWKILRATFGSRLFAEGVPDRTIADLLGHTRTATTHRHYISTGAASADALEAIGRLVG